jgi:aryl-alcohol dehydrogenase-like predicted oxidoreductase
VVDQIRRSRANLGVECIDLYYLHNPEQQLSGVPRATFEQRLALAFEALEQSVTDGAIRAYGCATWHGFRTSAQASNALQLETVVRIATDVGGAGHHLAAIQLPLNLGMAEGMRLHNQVVNGVSCTLLQAAHELGIAVVASAGLMHGQLTHDLPTQLREIFPAAATDAQRAIAFARTIPGVTSVLIGMRSPEHIRENLRVVV